MLVDPIPHGFSPSMDQQAHIDPLIPEPYMDVEIAPTVLDAIGILVRCDYWLILLFYICCIHLINYVCLYLCLYLCQLLIHF